MKRYLLPIMLIMTVIFSASANDNSDSEIDRIFDEFSAVKDADYVNISPFMMKMASMAASLYDREEAKMAGKIKSIKVLSLDNSPNEHKNKLNKRVAAMKFNGYEELVRSNDGGQHVRVLVKIKDDYINRLIVASNDSTDCTLISITGKFTKDDIGNIVKDSTKMAKNQDGGR